MRFVYRNRKLALFGMFFLFGAMMILIKFTEFSPTCLFREETAQAGPIMVRDQVRKPYTVNHQFQFLWFIRKSKQWILNSWHLVHHHNRTTLRSIHFVAFAEIYTRKRQTLLSIPSTDAIDFHWWCTTIRYHTNASHAWCTSRRSVSIYWMKKQLDFSVCGHRSFLPSSCNRFSNSLSLSLYLSHTVFRSLTW